MPSDGQFSKCQALIDQARADRQVAESSGDLGTTVFIDGFIAGAIEARAVILEAWMLGDR